MDLILMFNNKIIYYILYIEYDRIIFHSEIIKVQRESEKKVHKKYDIIYYSVARDGSHNIIK